MIPVVRFTQVEAFVEDLKKDAQHVPNAAVWANGVWTSSPRYSVLQHVTFVATTFVSAKKGPGFIYKLEMYLGEVMQGDSDQLSKINKKIAGILQDIRQGCHDAGLDLRVTGVIQT
ncbi:MAG: hypothetical protein N2Z75_09535 [Meiothermus sp.]|nr:hypothetical protein [Meiothermus sp.]